MSTRTTLRPMAVLTAASMAVNQTSLVTVLQSLTKISYALSWTGATPVGTVSVQGSNDYALGANGAMSNAGTWTSLSLQYNGTAVLTIPVSGNTGTGLIDLETGAYALRLIYTAGSGSGSLTAVINGKVA